MEVQKGKEGLLVFLAGFSEEPAYRLVNQIMRMVEKNEGNVEGVLSFSASDEGHCGDHPYSLFPQGFTLLCKIIEEFAVFVFEVLAKEFVAGEVYEIPVVNVLCMREVEVYGLLLESRSLFGVGENLHQAEQRRQPNFMELRGYALLQIFPGGFLPAFLYNGAGYGHFDSQELISVSVFSFPGFEEAHEPFHLALISLSHHLCEQNIFHTTNIRKRARCAQRP